MASDTDLMEASLIAVADAGIDIRHALFERFLAAYPERLAIFYNLEAASRRMTDETLQMMFGLASDETWVWPLVAELVSTHRNYGALAMAEYDAFVGMTVDAMAEAAGAAWSADCDAAWRRQAERLTVMIHDADRDWSNVIPHAVAAG